MKLTELAFKTKRKTNHMQLTNFHDERKISNQSSIK